MKRKFSKAIILLLSLTMVLTAVIGGSLAFLISSPASVTNTFSPAKVDASVQGDMTSITIENTGEMPAYIRAAIVVTWKTGDTVYYEAPTDYSISLGTDWTTGNDGYYYYVPAVEIDASTTPLTVSQGTAAAPTGYTFTV